MHFEVEKLGLKVAQFLMERAKLVAMPMKSRSKLERLGGRGLLCERLQTTV